MKVYSIVKAAVRVLRSKTLDAELDRAAVVCKLLAGSTPVHTRYSFTGHRIRWCAFTQVVRVIMCVDVLDGFDVTFGLTFMIFCVWPV